MLEAKEKLSRHEDGAFVRMMQVKYRQCDDEARAMADTLTHDEIRRIFADDSLFSLWESDAPDSAICEALGRK